MSQNTAHTAPIVVLKFGGTSVASPKGRGAIALRVAEAIERGERPVIVVSAMGRSGDPYATDTLLALVEGLPASDRERDLLMSCGESISCVVLAHELRAAGIDACAFSGGDAGIRASDAHGCAAITEIDTGALLEVIESGGVPVVAGFQGLTDGGVLVTLGRGGSDTTAAALGVALGADYVDIYSDVDGIMTADPRVEHDARVLKRITSDELFQMARTGSKIVHTPAAELAFASGARLRVRNTFSDHEGTTVVDIASYRPDGVATAVSHSNGITRVRVTLPYVEDATAHMKIQTQVYRAMADACVSLDMFTPVNDRLVFTVKDADVPKAKSVLESLGLAYKVRPDLAKVTLVGAGMHGVPGVMARVADCLCVANVDILQVSDSQTTISVLVRADDMVAAVSALHSEFDL